MTYGDTVVIDGDVSLINQIDGNVSLNAEIDGDVGEIIIVTEHDLPIYTGATVVEPDFNGITLQTANKTLVSNVTVKPIKVESVSNLSGGRTVYIGGII